ncbi:LTA synthase family protein [uncultured Desulfobulbus sp.]|uniref:LTA synthase family protein n=1 Tax=uncultured Desulfobulbus sp. TaxID=239745 RepID=UPI0029C987A7|nr:LTA synthase family protein [uncultured Desulfobulbus sp.]
MLATHPPFPEIQSSSRSLLQRLIWISFFRVILADTRIKILLTLGCFYLSVSFLLRLVLFFVFGTSAGASVIALVPTVSLGVINDLITLCFLFMPLSLYFFLVSNKFHQSLPGRILTALIAWTGFFTMMYMAVIQYYFFKEFSSKFNLVAVDYLIYPHEVFGNIIESYHIIPIFFIVAVYASIMLGICWNKMTKTCAPPQSLSKRSQWLMAHVVIIVLCLSIFSTHSLDFSKNRVVNEITADGISSFFEALRTNHLDYNTFYRTGDPQTLSNLLRKELATDTSRSLANPSDISRVSAGSNQGLGKLNVVVIVEESMGCEQVDACGQGLDIDAAMATSAARLTPELDRLAKQGVFFNKAYATGTRTVRGLEAITASFPPIPSESIVKRPGNDHIATWGTVMQENGYHTSFLYGGFSQFDNMKTFYAGNGYAVSDRLDIENPRFTNIWGVSDQDLFDHARTYFDQREASGAPFFSIIMTTSNHSPYTFPVGIDGVRPHGGNRMDGVRYADYALGEFIEKSKNASWYENTLFVVVADHGARVYGSEKIPLQSYEIPLLIMAPGHVQPQQVASPISQIDIAPTVLGLLGLPYQAPFFGQNVLAANEQSRVLLFNHNHDVALYQDGKLAVLGLNNTLHTYRCRLGENRLEAIADDNAVADLAAAYYQTAFTLFTQHAYL